MSDATEFERGPDSLETVMAHYIERLEEGQTPDPAEYLMAYPQYAEELRSFFQNHHWFGQPAEVMPSTLVGSRIGPYLVEEEIARGGMGVVYRARQEGLERAVALKLISTGVLAGEEERRRFKIEAEAAARLQHPGIIAIHEIGTWQGYEYFSMALVEGSTLQKIVDRGHFDDQLSARLVRDVGCAVSYAHSAGIVHRDLKPDNILLNEAQQPLVADFGLAKWHREGSVVTRTGQVLGTPHYMSPEQATGRGEAGASTDIYSLGAILYALITGQPPHAGDSPAEVLRSVLQDEPKTPRQIRREASPELENICLKAMQYEPSRRYASADELADDLDRYLRGDPTVAGSSGLIDRVAMEIQRDQHQTSFADWGMALATIGVIIFFSHVLMFGLDVLQIERPYAYWMPRWAMLGLIFGVVYWARDGALLPRSVAERPVWSIWLGYLVTLGTVNLLAVIGNIDRTSVFPITSALSGFGFLAMAGHVWGGSVFFGIGFMVVALLSAWSPALAPLLYGSMWLISLVLLGRHYRSSL